MTRPAQTSLCCTLLLVLLATAASPLAAQEWTRFRGPNGAGHSDTPGLPTEFTADDYLFNTPLPGTGNGSPVLWGERVFLLSGDGETAERNVLCLSATTGEILWTQSYASTPHRLHQDNDYAPGTPCVDAEGVYAAWASPESTTLIAHDHQGEKLWELELGPYVSNFGFGTSPMLYGDLVILASLQRAESREGSPEGKSFVVAVDKHDGTIRWKSERPSNIAAYAVPCVLERPGQPDQLLCTSSAEGIFSLDPTNGELNWSLPVFESRCVASPIVVGDTVIANNGLASGGTYVVAAQLGDSPTTTPTETYRITQQAPYVPSPVAHGDLVILWSDKGIASCINAHDGTVHWRERIGGNFMSSPIVVDDCVYCMDETGVLIVLKASEEFELLARNPLGEPGSATPAVAGGRMYLRTESHLICIGPQQATGE